MAYSFENVKSEIRAMVLKVPEKYRSFDDTLIFLLPDYLSIQYGRNEALKKAKVGDFSDLEKQQVYSGKSQFLVEMAMPYFDHRSHPRYLQNQILGTPLKQFVSSLDQGLYHELYE